mgnify:CR=1 FL=1
MENKKNYKFLNNQKLSVFQKLINDIYGLPDNRLFSLSNLLSNQQRFTMRALKGIRKNDREKLKYNLLIAFSWLMAVGNRLHIDVEEVLWRRFPMICSYCGNRPCICKKTKPDKRKVIKRKDASRPKTLSGFQNMFRMIYPPESRTLEHAGVHLAEEMGEVSEAIYVFSGEHKNNQFENIQSEISDYISCIFGVANSANIDMADELAKLYKRNCHVCHSSPCECKFSYISKFKS